MKTWYVIHNDVDGLAEWRGVPRDVPETKFVGKPFFVRIEEHWNGCALRPPVGMRADEASHIWALDVDRNDKAWVMNLVPR